MKKLFAVATCAAVMLTPAVSAAGEPSFSINYADSSVSIDAVGGSHGVNAKFNYDPSYSRFGVVSSMTYTQNEWSGAWLDGVSSEADTGYLSLGIGPSFWFQPFMSIYALAGAAHQRTTGVSGGEYLRQSETTYIYGGGLRLNVYSGLILDAHYEYAPFEMKDKDEAVETYSVGMGWRF